MPARTLNDFPAGFFWAGIKAHLEVEVEGKRDKEKEVMVCAGIVHRRRKIWNDEVF